MQEGSPAGLPATLVISAGRSGVTGERLIKGDEAPSHLSRLSVRRCVRCLPKIMDTKAVAETYRPHVILAIMKCLNLRFRASAKQKKGRKDGRKNGDCRCIIGAEKGAGALR